MSTIDHGGSAAISYQLSAISYQLSAISYQLSAISYQRPKVSSHRETATFWLSWRPSGYQAEIEGLQASPMGDFRKLCVWKKSRTLTIEVYRLTRSFPPEERYGLTAQIRSAATSIMANIAEGCGRNRDRELARYLSIALGSASELESHVTAACDQKMIDSGVGKDVARKVKEIQRMLASLLRRLNTS